MLATGFMLFQLNIHEIVHVDILGMYENMHYEINNKSNAIFDFNLSKNF